jgi:hypothetical protein
MKCLSVNTVNRIVLPLVLKPKNLSEPGSESLFSALFSMKYEKDSDTPLKRRSLSLIQENHEFSLLSKEAYIEQVLPFVQQSLAIREYDARVVCLKLLDLYIQNLVDWDSSFVPTLIQEVIC